MTDLLQACFCLCNHGTEMHAHISGPCRRCECDRYRDNGATKRLLDQLSPRETL